MPKISVIVPVYNVQDYVGECLESICNQTFKDIEIIIVNDGSTDKSLTVCEAYKKKDKRIRIISQTNKGLSAARNKGIDNALGEYFIFIDSDDCIEMLYLEELYNMVKKCEVKLAAVGHRNIKQYSKDEYKKLCHEDVEVKVYSKSQALIEHLGTESIDVVAWNKIYAKELFEEIRYPEGELFEDMKTTYKLLEQVDRVAFLNKKLYCYRQRKGSIGHSEFDKKWYELSYAIDAAFEVARKYNGANDELEIFYFLWKMAFINKMISNRQKDKELEKKIRNNIRKNVKIIMKNNRITIIRKIEILLYAYFRHMYSLLYLGYCYMVK